MRNKLRLLKAVLSCDIVLLIATLLAGLALSAALPRTARADPGIIYVKADATGANNGTSWADAYTGLQAALVAANSGDEIWVAAGTYKPTTGTDRTATFQLKDGVALYGGFTGGETTRDQRDWVANVSILSGDLNGDDGPDFTNYSDNSYHVATGSGTDETAVVNGFTVTGGNANGSHPHNRGGGMYNDNGSPIVTNCTFTGNTATSGGGMYNENSNPTVTNCTFSGNSAYRGGGMFNYYDSNPTLTNCTLSGNSAGWGGGMYNEKNSNPALSDCTFSGNSAGDYGGGMLNHESGPTVTNCTFSGNSAYRGGGMYNFKSSPTVTNCSFNGNSASTGGGMENYQDSNPTLTDCTFSDNYADSHGGGMLSWRGSNPTLTNCTFSDNSARYGGGMANDGSSPALSDCTFSGNSAGDYGGGMFNWASSPALSDCTFSGNSADDRGGGMFNWASSPALSDCTFSGNSAGDYGGGMYNEGSSPTLDNCTFNDNSAAQYGGGMFNGWDSNPTVTNCTLSGNSAGWGGGMYNFESSPALRNTIVANSPSGRDCSGTPPTSEGYNLDSDGTCGFTGEGDLSNTDPLLGPLQDNGGPTLTHALLPGSPSIDAIPEGAGGGGYNGAPTTDQRGVSRPQPPGGDCDIGAYELERGTIIIEKQTTPAGGTGFGFTHDIGGGGSFSLDDGSPPKTFSDVLPGPYTVTEDDPTPAFDLTSITCDDGSSAIPSTWYVVTRTATINLDPDETVTCTFTNTQRGHIIVDKVTNPSGDPQSFDFTLIGGPSNLNQSFSLTDTTTPHDSGPVLSGSGYNVTETVPTGWGLTGATCSDGSQVNNINVSPGETVTCTFTNTKQFTLTVNKAGTGAGTVISDPAGISCGEDCTENYDIDAIITLEAQPGDDSVFVGWGGDCSGTELTTTVTMDADKTCTATFNLKPPPVPVGGYVVPVNRLELLAPWLELVAVASLVAVAFALWVQRDHG